MKIQYKQVLTIVGFFSLAIISTLTVSWGINSVVNPAQKNKAQLATIIIDKDTIKSKVDLTSAFKLLIPKIK